MKTVPDGFFFKGQLLHLLLLLALLAVVSQLVDFQQLHESQFAGVTTYVWFIAALVIPIIHQVYVWLAWRSELCFGTITKHVSQDHVRKQSRPRPNNSSDGFVTGGKVIGSRGFVLYRTIFTMLLLSRPLSLTLLAISDHDTMDIPFAARIVISMIFAIPAIYTLYSVVRYFGITRACGSDHFDPSYRDLPMVREGIFRYTGNAMYAFAFLLFWAIAVAGASWAALVVAMFSHAYIWVHYICTERPDMKLIHGSSS